MDYYSRFYEFDDHAALLGMTYNLSDMQQSMRAMTAKDTLYAILNQIALSLICLTLLYFVLLRPLKDVQKNIRFTTARRTAAPSCAIWSGYGRTMRSGSCRRTCPH